jgi:probable phosphoglycerate mutase
LGLGLKEQLPWARHGEADPPTQTCEAKIEVTEDIREWDYGDYEGITSAEIRETRAKQGIPGRWDIWKDGCPGGE